MSDVIVGIDLGTTNSEIAVYRDGAPVVLKDSLGRLMLPSVVGLSETGALLVGEEARNQFLLYPERTVRSIKRKMGTDVKVRLGDSEYAPQEISAMILSRLKEMAQQELGHSVKRAVITVPAYFSDAQRQATRDAGEIAGLEVVRIINEPTAAALVYEASQEGGKRILIYDLGGGTFDVSVVKLEQGVTEVIAVTGNNHLGGDDFDEKLVAHIVEHLKIKHGASVGDQPQSMARILRAAETAKKLLSSQPFATVREEYLTVEAGKPVNLSLEISRSDYEAMIKPFIDETLNSVHEALKSANMTPSDIDEVLLVGGSTRTPIIHERLTEVFGYAPRSEVDPDLCVAMGASMQGAVIAGGKVSSVLVDVTPYTFGTSGIGILDGAWYPFRYFPVIPRNTPIPVRRSEVFFTSHDNQDTVEVKVYQGEKEDAMENTRIGEFLIEGLRKVPEGNEIIMEMSLDRDGILHVLAREKATGLESRITIEHAMSHFDKAEIEEAKSRVSALFGEAEIEVSPSAISEIDALIAKANGQLEKAGEEDRAEMMDIIHNLKDAIGKGDADAVETGRKQLQDLLFFIDT